ncbi:MAG: right-handed parallel beta-helix repeat-containing protein [Thermomicrobiales bacterium]
MKADRSTPIRIRAPTAGPVQINPDGTFDYTTPPGFEGDDTFTYTLTNPGGSDTATVTITVSEVIWFIDDSAAGPGSGTITDPFDTIANFNSLAADDAGDTIFVYEGSYSDAFGALQNEQQLIGQGVDLATVTGFTLPPFSRALPGATTNPVISLPGSGDIVPIADDNLITGLTLDNATRGIAALSGASGTNVDQVTITNMGGAGIIITPSTDTTITNATFDNVGGDIELNAENTVIQDIASTGSSISISISNITGSLLIERADIEGATDAGILLEDAQAGSTSTLNDVAIDDGTGDGFRATGSVAGSTFDINNLDVGATTPVDGESLEFANNAGEFDFDADSSVVHSSPGIAFSASGDSGTLTYNGDINATGGQFIEVVNDTGTKTFQNGTLQASNVQSAYFDNADGTYNFLGTTTMTGTADGF